MDARRSIDGSLKSRISLPNLLTYARIGAVP